MNSFTELVEKIFNERFPYVIDKILANKIPVAFLSAEPTQTAVDVAKKFRSEGLNITHVILAKLTDNGSPLEFDVVTLKEITKVTPQVQYIFTYDLFWNKTAARIALNYASSMKIITLIHENQNYNNFRVLDAVKRSAWITYNFFLDHVSDFYRSYSSLIDEESRRTFCGYWIGLICYQFGEFVYSN